MAKVLFVLTSNDTMGETGKSTGYYLPEVAHPHHALTSAGHEIDYVSPKGGEPPVYGEDSDDPVVSEFWQNDEHRRALESTATPDQIDISDYDAIFFAGGHGTMWDFPDETELADLARALYEDGGIVAAVCHGPAALLNIKLSDDKFLIDGKKVTGFTTDEEEAVELKDVVPFLLEEELPRRGATYETADRFQPHVIVDGRVVTGQNPASAAPIGERLAEMLSSN